MTHSVDRAKRKRDQARKLAWVKANPEKIALQVARARAKRTFIEFSITVDDLYWPDVCPILGLELNYFPGTKKGKAQPNSPSLDRIDPSKGYIPGNVAIISFRANWLKAQITPRELSKIAKYAGVCECK